MDDLNAGWVNFQLKNCEEIVTVSDYLSFLPIEMYTRDLNR